MGEQGELSLNLVQIVNGKDHLRSPNSNDRTHRLDTERIIGQLRFVASQTTV